MMWISLIAYGLSIRAEARHKSRVAQRVDNPPTAWTFDEAGFEEVHAQTRLRRPHLACGVCLNPSLRRLDLWPDGVTDFSVDSPSGVPARRQPGLIPRIEVRKIVINACHRNRVWKIWAS